MLYIERNAGGQQGWSRVFSDKDNERELDRFRCMVRAPQQSLYRPKDKTGRLHLSLFGEPRTRALNMLTPAVIHESTGERILWERTQEHIMKRHPDPFVTERVSQMQESE
jgi:hypothetical protein